MAAFHLPERKPSGAPALFRIENGKLAEFIKDWNKLSMWEQFCWPLEECLTRK
jgi:hypothetical protein